jgi:hypothetical protein
LSPRLLKWAHDSGPRRGRSARPIAANRRLVATELDAGKFAAIDRGKVTALTRRQTLRGSLAASLATASAGGALTEGAADRCKKAGAWCRRSSDCCPNETDRRCRVQRNAGNSDTTR